MTVIPIVNDVLGAVTKGSVQGQEDLETIQFTALLKLAWILRRLKETCYHSNSSGKPANTDVKNSQKGKIIIIKSKYKIGDHLWSYSF